MKKRPFINNAHDEKEPIPYKEIHSSKCIRCQEHFNGSTHIMWTRLSSGKVIWWHINEKPWLDNKPCEYKNTESEVKSKKISVYKKFEEIRKKHEETKIKRIHRA